MWTPIVGSNVFFADAYAAFKKKLKILGLIVRIKKLLNTNSFSHYYIVVCGIGEDEKAVILVKYTHPGIMYKL